MPHHRVKVTVEFALRDRMEYLLFEHAHPHVQPDALLLAASSCPVFKARERTVVEETFEAVFTHVYADTAGTRVQCEHCHAAYRALKKK